MSCKVIGISVICNIFLCIIKLVIGIISNSQALIADGIHSFEDVSSSVISLIGSKIASKDNCKIYPFGIERSKYIFSLTVSILMIMISVTILKNSISSFFEHSQYIFNFYSLIVCYVTILVKLVLYIYAKFGYIRTKNILVKSTMLDHRNDIIVTMGVIVSIVVTKYNLYIIDYIVSIIISLLIFYTGIKIFLESYNTLMCKSVENIKIKEMFCNNLDILNMGDNYIVIIYLKKDETINIEKLYNEKIISENNISQILIRYM